ncbi:MAG: hypothetical protein ACRC0L_10460 [Angustibacter sp.]
MRNHSRFFLAHFTTDAGRYLAPPAALFLGLLLAKNQGYWQGSSMRATSETEISIVILAPLATFLGVLSGRSANLRSSFLYATADRSLLRACTLGSLASASWLIAALAVIWGSAALRAALIKDGPELHLGVFLLDVVVLFAASCLGHHIARKVESLWWQTLAPMGVFIFLNASYYIPQSPALMVIPRANYAFFPGAAYNPVFLGLQASWVLLLGLLLLAWTSRIRRGALISAGLTAACLILALATQVPPYFDSPGGATSEFANSPENP